MLPGYLLILNWPVDRTGGVNEVVLSLARELQAGGRYHPMIAIGTWDPQPQPASARGVEIVNLRMRDPWDDARGLRIFAGFLATLGSDLRLLSSFLRMRNVLVVNAHFPGPNAAVFLLMKYLGLFRGKILLSFHGADMTAIGKSRGLCRAAWRILLTTADAAVPCSEALGREILAFAPKARVTTIHNGMDLELFNRPRVNRAARHAVLHIGKFEHKKSQDIVLRAFHSLLRTVPDATLRLVGAPGPAIEAVRALVVELALEKSVEIHVNVPHERMPEFMAEASLFVLPSRSEGLPVVLLEVGAAGLPVVATRVSGIPELIEDGVTGILVPVESVEDLASAMHRLLTDDELSDRLARKWHERSIAGWSWARTCAKYVELAEGQERSATKR